MYLSHKFGAGREVLRSGPAQTAEDRSTVSPTQRDDGAPHPRGHARGEAVKSMLDLVGLPH